MAALRYCLRPIFWAGSVAQSYFLIKLSRFSERCILYLSRGKHFRMRLMHVCFPLQVAKAVQEAETRRGPLRDHRPLVLNQDDFLVGPGVWQMPCFFLPHLDAVAPALHSAALCWPLAGFLFGLRGVGE